MSDAIVSDSKPCALLAYPASGTATAYTFLRHIGFILDELSAQGLVLWLDDNDRWQWRWQWSDLKSTQGFWVMGEAVVDGVVSRFPKTFAIPNYENEIGQKETV